MVLKEKAARKEMRVDSLYSREMKSRGALIEYKIEDVVSDGVCCRGGKSGFH